MNVGLNTLLGLIAEWINVHSPFNLQFTVEKFDFMALQLLMKVANLENLNIAHSDLKPENIYL